MLHHIFGCQIQHFFEAIIIGKRGAVLGDFPEVPVEALDDIVGIYDSLYLRRICVKAAENIPIVLPAFDAGGTLFSPSSLKRR